MIERESLRVYQLSVFVLAVEWILFGSMHFTARLKAEAMIPPGFPWKTFIAVVTGMVEVTVGILLLITRTRRYAAVATLVLLAAFLPSIYRMLAYDEALGVAGEWRSLARVLLVPNHVFMALCAIYLYRWPRRPAFDVPPPMPRQPFAWPMPTFAGGGATLTVAVVMVLANLAGFWVVRISPVHGSTAQLWAMMCLAVGGLLGFLFGIPRVTLDGTDRVTHRPNSNVEIVSDWLTKIIVGVGLLQFHSLGRFVDRVSTDLGQALGGGNAARASSFARALIVYFFIAGVIQGYLLTRMYLSERFEEFEAPPPPAPAAAEQQRA
ncbi:MAG TPA: hypothetical protein VF006_28180 [Longimicrobium sp.]